MSQRTITIELKVDLGDPAKDKIMDDAARAAAKHLLSTAALLQDSKRTPLIAVSSDDHFDGHKVIELTEDLLAEGPEETKVSQGEGAHSEAAQYARSAGYTVSDRGNGWFYNDPDGAWSATGFANEAAAWDAAWSTHNQENKPDGRP